MQVKYIWREKSYFSGDAQKVGEELAQIEKKHGQITPDLVVEEAKSPQNYLHRYFEWDDKKAAHNWRKQQARQLIRSIKVVFIEKEEEKPQIVRAFLNIEEKTEVEAEQTEQYYMSTIRVIDDYQLYKQAISRFVKLIETLQKELEEIESFKQKHFPADFFRTHIQAMKEKASELACVT